MRVSEPLKNNGNKLEVMDFNPHIEKEYTEKVQAGVENFKKRGGNIVMFDIDGTIRGNNFSEGVANFVRTGFMESYELLRNHGLQIEICTLRDAGDIPDFSKLGVSFDRVNGQDTMNEFVRRHPSVFQDKAEALLQKDRQELISDLYALSEKLKSGVVDDNWKIFLQAAGIHHATREEHKNIKILFMAHRLSKGEMTFLVDDDVGSGNIAELLQVGVLIPQPEGYVPDHPRSD